MDGLQGIPPHVDNHECCDDTIMSLSLLSDVVMNFTDLDSKKITPINLPRRSLLVMTGKVRYAFRYESMCFKDIIYFCSFKGWV